jgi:hypothetical protein
VVGLCINFFSFVSYTHSQDEGILFDASIENPLRIVGSIYSDPQTSPIVESVKSWGSYLYLAVRYLNGDQQLEVWNVRDPLHPVMSESLDFGNLMARPQDHWKFPSVNVFDDVLLVRSNFQEIGYHHGPDGRLVETGRYDFAESVAEMINEEESIAMSAAASYGVYFGRIANPEDVAAPEEEYGYTILNFTNPLRPFVSMLVPPKSGEPISFGFAGHLNGALENHPAVISVSENRVSIFSRRVAADGFLDVFWEPRIPQIFNIDALHRTVRAQIDHIVNQLPLTDQFADVIERYFTDLDLPPNTTVEDSIRSGYESTVRVQQIFDDYQIDENDSIKTAIQKITAFHLRLELEKELSISLFSPVLGDWSNALFQIPANGTKEELIQSISTILNDGLSPETVARYILDKYVAPYVAIPDWLTWTMRQLIDEIVDSDAGEAISVIIGAAHDTVTGGDFLDDLIDLIPGVDVPDIFPEDCRDVLEFAFFESGAKLNPEGLAFLELLKFYQYFNGNSNYLNFENELAAAVTQLQENYAEALTDTIEPFMASLSLAGDIQQRVNAFSAEIPLRSSISPAIADAVALRLQRAGIDVNRSVHDVMNDYHLYLDLADAFGITQDDLATVEDLLRVLREDIGVAQTPIHQIWEEGKTYAGYAESVCRQALTQTIREAWGELDLDQSMHSALREFLGNHIDSRWTFGFHMDELLQEFVYSCLTDYPGFIDRISIDDRIDILAQWQYAFQLAAAAASLLDWTQSLSFTCEALAVTMEITFQQATKAAMSTLLSEFASILQRDMFGGFSDWSTTTEARNYVFDVGALTSLTPIRTEAFLWENRVGVMIREEWDFIHPRRVALILFEPDSPESTKREIMLGEWGSVDYVHAYQGLVMIGGDTPVNSFPTPTAMILALDDDKIILNKIYSPFLAASTGITTVNHGAHVVLYGPGGVYLLPHPMTQSTSAIPPTHVGEWTLY